MSQFQVIQITPFVPCSNLARQIAFYRDMLGFELGFQADNYAFMRLGNAAIRLIEVAAGTGLEAAGKETSFYIDVSGLDALYARLQPGLKTLPKGRVRAPFVQDYGQREFHVKDEDCTLVLFGEAVAA
ncbi:bleomycin resistance protein [Shimia sp.]|uniref:bleomycin resistance protein n=1 Tax=Shimia sp. TaxID=1954381 RepID=UPI003B8B6D67